MSRGKEGERAYLSSHEGELLADATSDDRRVDDKTLGDVLESSEDDVGGEEGFGDGDTTVGAVKGGSQDGREREDEEKTYESSRVRSNH